MNTGEAIKIRSSTRCYTSEPLTESEIRALVEAGLRAPTATDRRELHFTVLKGDNPLLRELGDEVNRLRPGEPPRAFCYDAPLFIVISGEAEFKWTPVDAGIAAENIALMAEELGLGSVIVGCVYDALRGEKRGYFEEAFRFPTGYEYEIAVAVGHKAAGKPQHDFDAAAQVTYL